jgi:hypothetical protein
MTAEVELFEHQPLATVKSLPVAPVSDIDSWVRVASDVIKLAGYVCETEFVPKNYRGNAPATAAAILAGRELGLPPFTSLRHVHVVEGSPSLSAEYKRARVLAAGHELDIVELTTTRCKVQGRRRASGKPPLEITFTIDDAKRAGLVKSRGAWETRPRRMLFARAATEVCDFLFADITNGLPTTELLADGGGEDEFGGYAESPGQEPVQQPPKPAARTARRKTAAAGDDTQGQRPAGTQAPRPQDAGDSTARDATPGAAGAAPSRGAQPLPPLPGEDDEPETAGEVAKEEDAAPDQDERHRALVGIVWAHLTRLGYPADKDEDDEQRAARLADVATLAGVSEIGSTSDLDTGELSQVADTLSRCTNRARLKGLLDAARRAGDGDA